MNTPDADGTCAGAAGSLDIRLLLDAQAYPHPVHQPRLIETHISWVLLTGRYAYKIKKPLNLGFLDYSTLALRRQACEDELRLNRRLAPSLYLEVVTITGTREQPRIGGTGEVLEYAVKMREFDQDAQLDRLLAADHLQESDIDALGDAIAAFHDTAPPVDLDAPYGQPASIWHSVQENFDILLAGSSGALHRQLLALHAWSRTQHAALTELMTQRRAQGRVRELHGDLHLANLVRLPEGIVAFDCIEFNPSLRWLDVISDLAFATMDLRLRGRDDLAYGLLDRYLQSSGDYAGLRLLRYYEVYRALVRAKVALIRRDGSKGGVRTAARAQLGAYVKLAGRLSERHGGAIVLMHGLAGSGKTWLSGRLLRALPAIRLRSDVERKRLHGLRAGQSSRSPVMGGIYSPAGSERTYVHLAEMAAHIVAGGEIAIIDATFLRRADRSAFRRLAGELQVPFAIVSCMAPMPELQRRIRARLQSGRDASEADRQVLAQQLVSSEPLDDAERRMTLTAATGELAEMDDLPARLKNLLRSE